MHRLVLIGLGLLAGSVASAQTPTAVTPMLEPGVYAEALRRADQGDIAQARRQAGRDPLFDKYLRWLGYTRFRGGDSFEEILKFMAESGDWPHQAALKRRAEELAFWDQSHARVLAWFEQNAPTSRDGRLRHADALRAAGRAIDADYIIRRVWVEEGFGDKEEKTFLDRWQSLISAADHQLRLDRLLWRGQTDAAKRQMARVDAGHKALAEARMKLAAQDKGADAAVKKVPAALQNDAGLIYERLRALRRAGGDDEARAILLKPPADLIRPDLWWAEREIQVRRAIADRDLATAYRLAQDHRLGPGVDYLEGEWLAGWVALKRQQGAPALKHFKALFDGSRSTISQARGAYWAGRASELLKRKSEAESWYIKAAAHPTAFYGQLAVPRLGLPRPPDLAPDPEVSPDAAQTFAAREPARLARLLGALGEQDRIDPFIYRLGDVAGSPEMAMLTSVLARDLGRTDLAVAVARRVQREGIVLVGPAYPTIPVPEGFPTEMALVHALIRQESNFSVSAISRAGARGLMQLMPATARQTAGKISMPYSLERLITDAGYNMQLGQAYLGQVMDGFDGSYVLTMAAYNAGPARVRQWMRDFGDPREEGVDVIDWIERIPFNETRNYVQRVLEGLQVYRLKFASGRSDFTPTAMPLAGSPWCLLACTTATAEAAPAPALTE